MSYATIRAAINTAISAVAGITGGAGKVLNFQPSVSRLEDYKTQFQGSATDINGWTISRERFSEEQQDGGFRFKTIHDIIVRGYGPAVKKGAIDTEENTLQDLIDAVHNAIRGDETIWIVQPEDDEEAIQTGIIEPISFGSVFVHHCEMRFRVEEIQTISIT